jgi:hypothetical protein
MNEIIAALVGALIGSIVSLLLSEHLKNKDEIKKVMIALNSETIINLEVASEILDSESKKNPQDNTFPSSPWCEIIPFSDAAWNSAVGSGHLRSVKTGSLIVLIRAYTMINAANYLAFKIQSGRFDSREGAEYKKRVELAKVALEKAKNSL